MSKDSFVYYNDWAQLLLELPDTLRLKIDDAVKRYVLYGEEPTDNEVLYSMFGLMRKRIDKDSEKYEHVCHLRRENGAKGGKQKAINASKSKQMVANASKSKQNLANLADNDNDNDNDKIKERTIVPKKKISLPIEQRKEDFKESIAQYREKYDSDLLNDFFTYWTEPTPDKKKMRYELEKTWSTGGRLSYWERRAKNG